MQNKVCSQCCPIVKPSIVPASQMLRNPTQVHPTTLDQNMPKWPVWNIVKVFKKTIVFLNWPITHAKY